ncbi:MAG: transposase [candidate division Zixibacteria bacterium]|nr:transposase [candidate division Zixibacteria bacterium]
MPRRGRSQLGEQRIFFATTTAKEFKDVFDTPESLRKLREIIVEAVRRHSAKLYGYVLMPNHFHLLIGLERGGPDLSAFMRDVKSISWRLIFPCRPGIWMARFDDVAVFTEDQFRTKLNYIHNNPVRAGLAVTPESYESSSALAWLRADDNSIVTTEFGG